MMQYLPGLAHEIHSVLKSNNYAIKRTQVHEGLASCFGYNSLAAMKTDPKVSDLRECLALILNASLGASRFARFGLTQTHAEEVVRHVRDRLTYLVSQSASLAQEAQPKIYISFEDFLDRYHDYASDRVFSSEEASVEMAVTNATYDDVDIDNLRHSAGNFFNLAPGSVFNIQADASIPGDQIDEKLLTDNDLQFSITATFEKVSHIGVRLLQDDIRPV